MLMFKSKKPVDLIGDAFSQNVSELENMLELTFLKN